MQRQRGGSIKSMRKGSDGAKIKISTVICAALVVPFTAAFFLVVSFAHIVFKERSRLTQFLADPKVVPSFENKFVSDAVKYHIIFSTGCSTYQDWQSYLFFHGALTAGQPGNITRIVSGCSDQEEATLRKLFKEQIEPMAEPGRLNIHFTPDYSNVKKGANYPYWNKPFGTKHWLEHVLGFPDKPIDQESIVALLDPDQLIIRPFINNDFSNTEWKFLKEGQSPRTEVEHGKPMGQMYGFWLDWKDKINMAKVTNESSPVDSMSDEEATEGYIVGPPYFATAIDMYRIAVKWSEFAVPVYDQYPDLLGEMFAYCLAAAHLRLAHQTAQSFMVSHVGSIRVEGWLGYVDKLADYEICGKQDPSRYPNVVHFCQHYNLGEWYFGKRRFPKNFLSCSSPLLKEPTTETMFNDTAPVGDPKKWKPEFAKRHAFMLFQLITALNDAGEYFKRRHCEPTTANFEKIIFPSPKYFTAHSG